MSLFTGFKQNKNKKETHRAPDADMSAYLDSFETQEQNEENNPFLYSLKHLTPEQTAPNAATDGKKEGKDKKKKKKGAIAFSVARALVIIVCACVFVYCVIQLADIVTDYAEADNIYNDIAAGYESAMSNIGSVGRLAHTGADSPLKNYAEVLASGVTIYTPPANGVEKVTSLRFQRMLVYLEDLRQKNRDTFGYIKIDSTKVNYPVVQSEDNSYYLTHSFTGTNLKAGAIFADFRCPDDVMQNQNLVIYGHNMSNGAMFHALVDYLDEDFFMTHDIELSTFDGIYTFRVFSVYATPKDYQYFVTDFPNSQYFLEFCETAEKKSIFHREGISFSTDDVLLTLSTCVTGDLENRYAIHAKLIKVEN